MILELYGPEWRSRLCSQIFPVALVNDRGKDVSVGYDNSARVFVVRIAGFELRHDIAQAIAGAYLHRADWSTGQA